MTEWPVADLDDGDEDNYTEVATRAEQLVRETPSALLLLLDGTEHWVPRSQVRRDQMGRLHVADWFIEKKGIA